MPDLEQMIALKLELKGGAPEALKKVGDAAAQADKKIELLEKSMGQVKDKASEAKGQLLQLAGVLGLGLGIHQLAEKFIGANLEVEGLQKRLQALVAAKYQYGNLDPQQNFEQAGKQAQVLADILKGAADKYSLSMEEMVSATTALMPSLSMARMSTKDSAALVVQFGRMAQQTGMSLDETTKAFQGFLSAGDVDQSNPVFGLLGLKKMPVENFSTRQRLDYLQRAMKKFGGDSAAANTTLANGLNVVRTKINAIMREAGKPVFEAARVTVGEIAAYLEKNQAALQNAATIIAAKFVPAVKLLGEGFKFVVENAQQLVIAAQAFAAIKFAKFSAEALQGQAQWIEEFSKKNATGGGAAFGKAASAALVLEAAAIGYAIGTAINGLLEQTDTWKKMTTPAKSKAEEIQDKKIESIKADEALREKALTRMFMQDSKSAGRTPEEQAAYTLKYLKDKGLSSISVGEKQGLTATYGQIYSFAAKSGLIKQASKPKAEGLEEKAKPNNLYDFRYSRFDIRQNFAEGFDPDRIAAAFSNDLANMGEHRVQSNTLPPGLVR